MKEMKLEMVDKLGKSYSMAASFISACGEIGGLGIHPGHTPLLTTLKPGEVAVKSISEKPTYFYVSGGIMEVQQKIVTILADSVFLTQDINLGQSQEELENTKSALSKVSNGSKEFLILSKKLKELNARIAIGNKHK